MTYLIAFLFFAGVAVLLGYAFVAADPRALVRALRLTLGIGLIVVGGLLSLARRWDFGLPMVLAGVSALVLGRIGPLDLGSRGRPRPGSTSTVRSAFLEMRLDHDSGAMSGQVVAGAYAGRSLDDLEISDLQKLYRELAPDAESVALFEAYLDRRVPGWREDREADTAAGARGAANAGTMTDEEAYEVLGLSPGVDEAEIRAAHRRLMMRLHPDRGGTTFLAAKLNEAKDRLLRRHRR